MAWLNRGGVTGGPMMKHFGLCGYQGVGTGTQSIGNSGLRRRNRQWCADNLEPLPFKSRVDLGATLARASPLTGGSIVQETHVTSPIDTRHAEQPPVHPLLQTSGPASPPNGCPSDQTRCCRFGEACAGDWSADCWRCRGW